VTIFEKYLTENNGLERVEHVFVRFICKTMSRFLNAWCFDGHFWGERVKRSALSPLRLSAILFAIKFAFRRYRCGLYVSIMLCFWFLHLRRDAERLILLIWFIIIPASNGIGIRTRRIETEISMEVRILLWFWCWDILGDENIYICFIKIRFCSVIKASINCNQTVETIACRKYAKLLPEKGTMIKNKMALSLARSEFCTIRQNLFVLVQERSLLSKKKNDRHCLSIIFIN